MSINVPSPTAQLTEHILQGAAILATLEGLEEELAAWHVEQRHIVGPDVKVDLTAPVRSFKIGAVVHTVTFDFDISSEVRALRNRLAGLRAVVEQEGLG